MDLTLKKASSTEINSLYEILVNCGKQMHDEMKLNHWHPFMDIETFKKSLNDKQLFGVYENNSAIATFNISTSPRDYYHIGLWSNPGAKALYVGQLATQPNFQRKGLGKWCMNQIEQLAQEMNCESIRFDALQQHPWLGTFYEHLGYKACAIVTPNEFDLVCYEKRL